MDSTNGHGIKKEYEMNKRNLILFVVALALLTLVLAVYANGGDLTHVSCHYPGYPGYEPANCLYLPLTGGG